MNIEELAVIINDNPGAILVLDNDDWSLYRKPSKPVCYMTDDEHDQWASQPPLVTAYRDFPRESAHDVIILAMARLANITVEKV